MVGWIVWPLHWHASIYIGLSVYRLVCERQLGFAECRNRLTMVALTQLRQPGRHFPCFGTAIGSCDLYSRSSEMMCKWSGRCSLLSGGWKPLCLVIVDLVWIDASRYRAISAAVTASNGTNYPCFCLPLALSINVTVEFHLTRKHFEIISAIIYTATNTLSNIVRYFM